MPNYANNESAVREKIFSFLDAIPDLYRQQICLLANPAAHENGMWGAFLELQQFGLLYGLSILVHKDQVGDILPPIGAENGTVINLLLIGESNGIGHYSLLIPIPKDQPAQPNFKVKPITPTGDCMFDACVQALKVLQDPEQPLPDSSFAEIHALRAEVASRLQDADIRALFSNYLLTEHQHSAIEARLRLPHGALMDKAKTLRAEYSSAIYFSNLLRDVSAGNLSTFNLFVRQELRAQNHHNYTVHNLLVLPTIQPSQIMELLTQIYGHEASQTETAKIFCTVHATTTGNCDFRAAIAIEFLVRKYGVDINAQKNYHDLEQHNSYLTALHCAVIAKDLTAISVLCRLGADLTIVEKNNLTAVDLARQISATEHNPTVLEHLSMEANMQSGKQKDTLTTTLVLDDNSHDHASDSASDDGGLTRLIKKTSQRKLSFTKSPDTKPQVAEPPAADTPAQPKYTSTPVKLIKKAAL